MFDAFDQNEPGVMPPALQQHDSFERALDLWGRKTFRLDGPTRHLMVLRENPIGTLAMMSRADLSRDDIATLPDRLRDHGLERALVVLSPARPAPDLAGIGALPLMTPASSAMLDLRADRDSLRAGLHQKWRNRLKQAESAGLSVRRQNMPLTLEHPLFALDRALQQRNRFRNWPAAFTLAFASANPGAAKLFTAFQGSAPIAYLLALRYGAGACYHIGHNLPAGRAVSAHNLLLWQAMLWARSKGATQFDLGLLDDRHMPGLARFKRGTGAQTTCMGGTWALWLPLRRALRAVSWLDRNVMSPG